MDTLSLCICLAWCVFVPYSSAALSFYIGLALVSCLLVTKDEWVHARLCTPGEQWLHALLFILHPIVLINLGWIWAHSELQQTYLKALEIITAITGLYFIYQVVYWNFLKATDSNPTINNSFYETLGDRWYTAEDDPIALLRVEGKIKNPWVLKQIEERHSGSARILDIGCGGGFLTNALAASGHQVTGFDLSPKSLEVARSHDSTKSVQYIEGDAAHLPFEADKFDVVCSMDFLEHVEDPASVVREAARVLKIGGLFMFHTFNRNFVSWLLAVKGLEWVVQNAPKNIHLYRLFIRPSELTEMCKASGMKVETMIGVQPVILSKSFLKLLATGRVDSKFKFKLTSSLMVGYLGVARR